MQIPILNSGGETNLGFSIIGSPVVVDNPKNGTIWLNTKYDITKWSFAAECPANPINGEVWIKTGYESEAAFKLSKSIDIMIYPLTAHHYLNNEWIYIDAQIYKNDQWVKWWQGDLYNIGEEFVGITGGWRAIKGASANQEPEITKNSNSITIVGGGGQSGVFYTENGIATEKAIDLTKYSKLYVSLSDVSGNGAHFGVCTSYNNFDANTLLGHGTTSTSGVFSYDLPECDSGYILLIGASPSSSFTVTRIWLE